MPKIPVLRNNTVEESDSADYSLHGGHKLFSSHINLIPLQSAIQGARLFYGAKFYNQAMSLEGGEPALVQNLNPETGKSFDNEYGRKIGAVESAVDGQVVDVGDEHIHVKTSEGKDHVVELYKEFPYNRKSYVSHVPRVKVGDPVRKGDLLATSNYTDQDGTLALGKNLLTAVVPYKGHDFEDAIVISESAAKRMASQHLYGYDLDYKKDIKGGTGHFTALFPQKFHKDQIAKLDDRGVIKVGQPVNYGDPLILATGPRSLNSADAQLGRLHKVLKNSRVDHSQIWDKAAPGVVTDVEHTEDGVRVNVKSVMPLQAGDKLIERSGSKGIVSLVVPDNQMLRTKGGETVDIVMNPMGIISRINPGRIYSLLLGKIAKKTGKPYILPSFLPKGQDWHSFVKQELDKNGLSDAEEIFDPVSGKWLENPVTTGQQYVLKLHHTAASKLSGRDVAAYSSEGIPSRGGDEGAKRMSNLEIFALLSSGAKNTLKDAATIRGTKNPELWKALRMGLPLPKPEVPFIYNKFIDTLKAGGINVTNKNNALQIMPLTDKAIDALNPMEIRSHETVESRTLEPVPGGLFDPGVTGGADGRKWGKITLPEAIPNPIMEDPIRKILGVTEAQYRNILSGKEQLGGKSGPGAIKTALEKIDAEALKDEMLAVVRNGRGAARDRAVKVLGYLDGLKKAELQPKDWMLSKIPVIPPIFRPVTVFGDIVMSADANQLYRDLLQQKKGYDGLVKEVGYDNAGDERLQLYDSVSAIFGLGEPINPKSQQKGVSGFIRKIIGNSPKTGAFQAKVLSKPQDVVGRGTIIVNPDLDMDQVGIPEDMAWKLYRSLVVRRLARSGVPVPHALKEVENRSNSAEAALKTEMRERPIIYSRAPAWHKFNIMSAYPTLVKGDAIHISPLVTKGFGADFDGDCCQTYIDIHGIDALTSWHNFKKEQIMPISNAKLLTSPISLHIKNLPVVGEERKLSETVSEWDTPKGLKILALDLSTGRQVWSDVTKFSVHKNLTMHRVEMGTRNPVSVIVSADHSLVAYVNGKLEKLRPQDARPGTCIPHTKKITELSDVRKSVTALGVSLKNFSEKKSEIPLNRDFGFFIGAVLGNGWVDCQDKIYLSNTDPDIEAAFQRVTQLPGISTSAGDAQKWLAPSLGNKITERGRMLFCCTWFGRWLRPHIGSGAQNKTIPDFCFSASEEHLCGLLDGLICTDGSPSINSSAKRSKPQFLLTYSTTSMDLVLGLQHLAMRLGIYASCTTTKTPKGEPAYVVSISTTDFKRFVQRTGFRLTASRKQSVVDAGLKLVSGDSNVESSMDIVPYPVQLHTLICNIWSDARPKNKTAPSVWVRKGYWSRISANTFIAISAGLSHEGFVSAFQSRCGKSEKFDAANGQKIFEDFSKLVKDTTLGWYPVIKVEKISETIGYDLTVPGPYTFATSEGIFLQDSMNIHVPISDGAVEDARKLLLPSENLRSIRDFKSPMFSPTQEMILGLYTASKTGTPKRYRFNSKQELLAAMKSGTVRSHDIIELPD